MIVREDDGAEAYCIIFTQSSAKAKRYRLQRVEAIVITGSIERLAYHWRTSMCVRISR